MDMDVGQQGMGEVLIRFLNGPLAEQRLPLKTPVITIGRDPQNDIVVPDPRVPRKHACIRWQRGLWQIENLSQTSYVAVNQQRTARGILQNESVIHLGSEISFVFLMQPQLAGGMYAPATPEQVARTPILPAPELMAQVPRV